MKADRVAIGIAHFGVAGAPEGVNWREVAGVARARQLLMEGIDGDARVERELQAGGPSANRWCEPGVIAAGQPVSTKCELYAVRNAHLDERRGFRTRGDREAKGAVERHAGRHIGNPEVDSGEDWRWAGGGFVHGASVTNHSEVVVDQPLGCSSCSVCSRSRSAAQSKWTRS